MVWQTWHVIYVVTRTRREMFLFLKTLSHSNGLLSLENILQEKLLVLLGAKKKLLLVFIPTYLNEFNAFYIEV